MAIRKLRRGILPQKSTHKYVEHTVFVAPSTPYIGALKRVDKYLNSGHSKSRARVRVVGSGRAIQTVLQLAAGLKERHYSIEINTISLTAVDEKINDETGTSRLSRRDLPAAEIIIAQPRLP